MVDARRARPAGTAAETARVTHTSPVPKQRGQEQRRRRRVVDRLHRGDALRRRAADAGPASRTSRRRRRRRRRHRSRTAANVVSVVSDRSIIVTTSPSGAFHTPVAAAVVGVVGEVAGFTAQGPSHAVGQMGVAAVEHPGEQLGEAVHLVGRHTVRGRPLRRSTPATDRQVPDVPIRRRAISAATSAKVSSRGPGHLVDLRRRARRRSALRRRRRRCRRRRRTVRRRRRPAARSPRRARARAGSAR